MTPKEKAKELVYNKFGCSKQYALIAVDEIILSRREDANFDDTLWSTSSNMYTMHPMYLKYWKEVKQEIEKL